MALLLLTKQEMEVQNRCIFKNISGQKCNQ